MTFNFSLHKLHHIIPLLDACVYFRYKAGKNVPHCNSSI